MTETFFWIIVGLIAAFAIYGIYVIMTMTHTDCSEDDEENDDDNYFNNLIVKAREYSVGDRAVIVEPLSSETLGKKGTVVGIKGIFLGISLDNFTDGHNLDGLVDNMSGLWVIADAISPVIELPKKPAKKVAKKKVAKKTTKKSK